MSMRSRSGGAVTWARRAAWALLTGATLSCSADRLTDDGSLPPDVPDPATIETPQGAVAAYRSTLEMLRDAVGSNRGLSYVKTAGILTDELAVGGAPVGIIDVGGYAWVDSRTLLAFDDPALESDRQRGIVTKGVYGDLHGTRGQAQQARGLLSRYAPDSAELIGHLYTAQGYAEIYLADLFCSGIPLSTVDFAGDYTAAPGSTTQEVYQHALSLFDSALALPSDSIRVRHLAAVGKARALLALGRYAEAGTTVAEVPDAFRYELRYQEGLDKAPLFIVNMFAAGEEGALGMSDLEGGHGLDFLTSGDPRTAGEFVGQSHYGYDIFLPLKYPRDGSGQIPMASGVEARLIEAEAALQAGDPASWLGKLNHLRQTAIAPALPDTTDPGTEDARVDLMFRERAFWLYLTGHRQGDLRRLVREYRRDPQLVYPTGAYVGGSGRYGTDVTAPVPAAESRYNPQYGGCFHRNA